MKDNNENNFLLHIRLLNEFMENSDGTKRDITDPRWDDEGV